MSWCGPQAPARCWWTAALPRSPMQCLSACAGCRGGRVDAQEKLLKLSNAETRIVPSYGPVVGRAKLQAELDMTRELFDRMLDLVRKGMSAQDMLDAGSIKGLSRTFRDPFRFT